MKSLNIGCGGSEAFPHQTLEEVNCDIQKSVGRIVNFVLCDAHQLPFADNSFLKITCYDVIEHLGNPLGMLREVYRVLLLHGLFIIGTPNSLHIPKILRSCIRGFYGSHEEHIFVWGAPELSKLLRRAGFSCKVLYRTYLDEKQHFIYELFEHLCPFPALKHRQLVAYCRRIDS